MKNAGGGVVFDGDQTADLVVDDCLITAKHPGVTDQFLAVFTREIEANSSRIPEEAPPMSSTRYKAEPGQAHPLGATPDENGVSFSVFSQNVSAVELLLFDQHDDPEPVQSVPLNPKTNKTFHFWRVYMRGLKPGMHYAYRVDGPDDPGCGHRFNRNKVLLDSYVRGCTKEFWRRGDACDRSDNLRTSLRGAVVDLSGYDWKGELPLKRPLRQSVIYQVHVGGFRFDEGSILSRGEDGAPMAHPPVTWNIELSETLADTKLIAEAWDAARPYQVGYFPGWRWAEWNGRFRDDLRRFVRGDAGWVSAAASRLAGSSDIFQGSGHLRINSVNFITCHDGFTLNDLVFYNGKHNEANGEGNRDGADNNLSWNWQWGT